MSKTSAINPTALHKDKALILQWQNGDEDAFKAYYKLHFGGLVNIALKKVGLLHVAEELAQDAFIDFYAARDKIKDTAFAYLKTILRNKVFDYYHRNRKSIVIPLYDEEPINEPVAPSLMDAIYERETATNIGQRIRLLPEQCRNIFLMSRQQSLSNKEIAEQLGISVKTVEGHITKALKYLREYVDYNWAWWTIMIGVIALK